MTGSPNPPWHAAAELARAAVGKIGVVPPEVMRSLRDTQAVRTRFIAFEAKTTMPQLAWVSEAARRSIGRLAQPDLSDLFREQRTQLQKLVQAAARSAELLYPPNLRGIEDLTLAAVDVVVMEEGIPLAGIPRTAIARALIQAPDAAHRRAILGRRWREIVDDCEDHLAIGTAAQLEPERKYVRAALAALKDGHAEAAQALAANLLDTILTRHFAAERIILVPGKKVLTPQGYGEFMTRKYWAVAPIWSAYQRFFPQNGDPVPRRFARHATAHAVSHAQFSRRNAVQAVMLVTSLVGYLDEELTGRWP